MYIIYVRPISDILPRIYAVDSELPSGAPGATLIVPATAPLFAVERAFQLFPEYLREGRQGRVREIECAVIDWETSQAQVIEREVRKPEPEQTTKSTGPRRRHAEESRDLRTGQHV